MNNSDFAKFIDELRDSCNMSREQLVDGIISERQYYRFLNGESALKNDIIDSLFNRMKISHSEAYSFYNRNHSVITIKLDEIDQIVAKYNYKDAEILLDEIDYTKIQTKSEQDFYNIMLLRVQSHLGKIPYNLASERIIKIINYPDLLNKDYITRNEVIGLDFLFKYFGQNKDYRIAKTVYDSLTKKTETTLFVKGLYESNFLIHTSKMLGVMDEYEKSIAVAEIAIDSLNQKHPLSNFALYYLTIATGAKNLNDMERVKENLSKVYMLLHIEKNNDDRRKVYEDYIKKVFNLSESDVISYK